MVACYICSCHMTDYLQFRAHMRYHEICGQISLPIRCMHSDCSSYFTKLSNLFRHVSTFHSDFSFETPIQSNVFDAQDADYVRNVDEFSHNDLKPSDNLNAVVLATVAGSGFSQLIETEAAALVASLRANSSIPYSVIPDVLNSCQHIIDVALVNVRENLFDKIPSQALPNIRNEIDAVFEENVGHLNFLSSRYKQDSYFSKHPLFVMPEEVVFGSRTECVRGQEKIVYDTFQYVCLEKTLRALLQSEMYIKSMLDNMERGSQCGLMSDFRDGEMFSARFNENQQFVILLQIFYDGMGTTNPLRGQSSLCNMGVFYYVNKNLPDFMNSCHSNVHLLALCYSHDLNVYGYGAVLNKFVAEMNKLTAHGFEGDFPVIGKQRIYVRMCQAVCDNLALNGLFGYIESFSCDFFCTFCLATIADIQTKFSEKLFMLRTRKNYESDLKKVTASAGKLLHSNGVKRACALNNLTGFHITENFALDIMHILLEGIVPLEIGCILYKLVTEKKLLSLADLNRSTVDFFNRNTVDKKNKPPELNVISQPGNSLSPSMKAVQVWTLLRFLPIILAEAMKKAKPTFVVDKLSDDEHWQFLCHLSHLVDLAFAPCFSPGMISYLQDVIHDHLDMFKDLFGDVVRLRAKHHLLVHLPTIVHKSGPLVGLCCLKYELKNSFFKRSSHIICNFTNVCKTLAFRHQNNFLFSLLSGSHIRDFILPGKAFTTVLSNTRYCECIVSATGCEATASVVVTTRMTRATVEYRSGSALIIGENNDMPLFGKIACFMSVQDNRWLIVFQLLQTDCFDELLQTYVVRDIVPASYTILTFEKLISCQCLFCFQSPFVDRNSKLIRMPCHIAFRN